MDLVATGVKKFHIIISYHDFSQTGDLFFQD